MSNRNDMGVQESRRKALVDKLIDAGLTPDEQAELHVLQKQAGKFRRRVDQTPPKPYNAVIEPTEDR